MANIHDCLTRAVQGGELDQGRAAAAADEFDQLVTRYANVMPRHQAEATAARHLKEATKRARRSRRHAVLNQLQSMVRLSHVIRTSDRPEKALLALLEGLPGEGFRGESVAWVQQALQARVRSDIRRALQETGLGLTGGSRDPAKLRDIIRELHGQGTGNRVAAGHAEAIRGTQTWLRQMFNAHGGDIGEIADYGLRHSHDARALTEAGFETWAAEVRDLLDWSRITDRTTGAPFAAKGGAPDDAAAERFLSEIYQNITTGGWINRDPSFATGGKALYNQRAEPRVLHFRDGDAWMQYNSRFGMSDPFTALVGGLDAMAREVAQMRVLGPNPNLGLEYAIQVAEKRAALSGDTRLQRRVAAHGKHARVLLQHVTGAINDPVHEGVARFFSNVRHWNVSAKLGSAILSSTGDLGTVSIGAAAMRMNPDNVLGRAVRQIASGASREEAARMGFVAETLMSMTSSSARLTNDVVATDTFSRLSGFTIRASGLSVWTDQLRIASQLEMAGHFAGQVGRPLGELDPMLRDLLERNGFTAADWDALRGSGGLFTAPNGGTFLAPFWWLEHQTALPRARAEGLATRLQAAMQDQLELMVPSRRLRGSALIIGETRPGTFIGELARSTAGFKNYAVSITIGQIAMFRALPGRRGKAAYLAGIAFAMPVLGALAMQLKELAKGRDPRPMDQPAFWLAATAQGGGLGIFGDFLFSETNRFGGGIEQTLAGPVAGLAGDVTRAGMSNVQRAAEGEEPLLGRDVANLVRYNTPVASSLWYQRLAFDRYVADELQRFLDPEAEKLWRRAERRIEREYGTRSWWSRGEARPERAPDLSNVMGDSR